MPSQVSERGQFTIDSAIRKELGVEPGMVAYQRVVDGHLEVLFLPAPHRRSLAGALHRPGEETRVVTGADMEAAVIAAVAEEQAREQDENA